MSKSKKELTEILSNQADLFGGTDPEPGSLDIQQEICNAFSKAISRSKKSRYQIAAEMSELVGKEITKSMLDSWTAESHHEHRFPCEFLPAFCVVCNDYNPLRILGRHCRCEVLESKDAIYARLAMLEKQRSELEAESQKLKAYLK